MMENKSDPNSAKWNSRAVAYDRVWHAYFRFMQEAVLSQTRIAASTHFLDLGCGTGWAVRRAAKIANSDGDFVGVDIARGMIDRARQNAVGTPNVRFYQCGADDLPLPSDYFDTIICTNSFHHYPRPEAALREAKRVLRTHGRLYVFDVTADHPFVQLVDRLLGARDRAHVKFYSSREYAAMFCNVGLRHVDSRRIKCLYVLKLHIAEKEA
jgi:ubiquinone/menaquinone biosynthesis C-methylase UbiE